MCCSHIWLSNLRRCILYLKLFLLGGFTWIFEVLSYTFNDHAPSAWIWMIVDFLNCLHGVLIFFVLILLRQRIRKELAGKTILFYTCPTKWANVENDEEVCLDCEGNNTAWIQLFHPKVTNTTFHPANRPLTETNTPCIDLSCFYFRQRKVRSYH